MPKPSMDYPENRELITVGIAASLLKTSRSAIYDWMKRGVMPFVDVYGRIMVDPAIIPDFRAKLEAREKARNALRSKGGAA